ncbi:MAG: ATP synthase F1 subunit epsilon [Methylococcaceae bacterium]|nr:MAG: ATP synthase F1 subunit epsilon [Methylococcaceae bacterium]
MNRSTSPLYFNVDIASHARGIYSGECVSLIAPSELGELCILPRHAPIFVRLRPGELRLKDSQGAELFFYVSGGFLEVQPMAATVLADEMLRSDEIDREAALTAKREAEQVLSKSHLFTERDTAKLMLVKALAQLRVIEHELASHKRH